MRRAAAALVVAVLGLLSLGSPTLADDRFQRNLPRERIEQRRVIEHHPAIAQQQQRIIERRRVIEQHPAIVQQQQRIIEQRRVIEQHPAIVQQQQRIIEQRRVIEQRRPAFQQRERFEHRPFIRDPDPFQRHLVIRPRDRFFDDRIEDRIERRRFIEHRERLGFRPVIPEREFFLRRQFIERHDGRVLVFVERDFHHWRDGHWFHGFRGGRFGWWWVIGPTWYLYPVPVYPYPDPASQMLVYQSPDIVVPNVVPGADICHEFHGDAIVNATREPFYGTACLQPDGQWHIVADPPGS